MELKELLVKWSGLEPERCSSTDPFFYGLSKLEDCWYCYPDRDRGGKEQLALLEYSIREAIELRGWQWQLEPYTNIFLAKVFVTTPEGCSHWCESLHSIPAIALLSAYLKALGVEL